MEGQPACGKKEIKAFQQQLVDEGGKRKLEKNFTERKVKDLSEERKKKRIASKTEQAICSLKQPESSQGRLSGEG